MRILELFSGTHSVGVVARSMGWEVVSLDLQDATITCDVLEWNYRSYPPCETFSNLRWAWVGRKLRRFGDVIVTPEMLDDDMLGRGLPILRKTEEIIEYFKPRFYIIENPRSGRMKDFLERPYVDVDYCRYGFAYRKSTRLWTNLPYVGKLCECKAKHAVALGKAFSVTKADKYRIPAPLVRELLEECLGDEGII